MGCGPRGAHSVVDIWPLDKAKSEREPLVYVTDGRAAGNKATRLSRQALPGASPVSAHCTAPHRAGRHLETVRRLQKAGISGGDHPAGPRARPANCATMRAVSLYYFRAIHRAQAGACVQRCIHATDRSCVLYVHDSLVRARDLRSKATTRPGGRRTVVRVCVVVRARARVPFVYVRTVS